MHSYTLNTCLYMLTTRSYVEDQTEPQNCTYIMARLSALQYGGFAATPILGSIFVLAGQQLCKLWYVYVYVCMCIVCVFVFV
ncbi:hypothetical protein EON63_23895 [archaeon]|nr:MAG: hypothetical protein EON63_23895 [archaeon]